MLTVRNHEFTDDAALEALWNHGRYPDFSNKLFINKNTLLLGDQIVGFAGIKVVAESFMFFKSDLSRKHKVLALREMIRKLKAELKLYGLDQCISFTDIPQPLMEHFGFVPCEEPTKVRLFL